MGEFTFSKECSLCLGGGSVLVCGLLLGGTMTVTTPIKEFISLLTGTEAKSVISMDGNVADMVLEKWLRVLPPGLQAAGRQPLGLV